MYGDLSVFRARAGRLADAWSDTTDPDEADLLGFLAEAAATLDMEIGARGLAVPVTDAGAVLVLAGLESDGALTMAIPATWPGGMPDEASGLLAGARSRWDSAIAAIRDGSLSVVAYLSSQGEDAGPGATAMWVEDPDYPLEGSAGYAEDIANPLAAPTAYRGQRY